MPDTGTPSLTQIDDHVDCQSLIGDSYATKTAFFNTLLGHQADLVEQYQSEGHVSRVAAWSRARQSGMRFSKRMG